MASRLKSPLFDYLGESGSRVLRPASPTVAKYLYLTEERIQLIEESLSVPRFRVDITDKPKYLVEFTREDKVFLPGIEIITSADVETMDTFRKAQILVRAVSLVLKAFGITVSLSQTAMRAIFKDTATAIENSSQMQRAIQAFCTSWNEAGDSPTGKASALFFLLKDSYAAGILWTIISSLCQTMSRVNCLKTVAKVSAMLIASLARNGAALIGRIADFGFGANDFAQDLNKMA